MSLEPTTKETNPKESFGVRKCSSSVVSQLVLMEINVAMAEGAGKYGRHNYRESGVRASVYYDALRRHADRWWEGQDTDPDSQLNHITKAITSLVVLRDAMLNGTFNDDRPPCLVENIDAFFKDMDAKTAAIMDACEERNAKLGFVPKHVTCLNYENKFRKD